MQAKSSRTAMLLCMVVGALTLQGYAAPVSYTHLTLPTILRV